jgi:peroxiredoxin
MAAAVLLLTACDRGSAPRAPGLGAPAPAFSAVSIDGAPVSLDSLAGQVVVLNLWATWCLPCRAEIPELEALHREFASQGVTLIGVSIDVAGMGGDVRDFAEAQGMSYPIWLDPDRRFSLAFLTVGVPETFVIDRAGIIRYRMIGPVRRGDTTLVAAVRTAMASQRVSVPSRGDIP